MKRRIVVILALALSMLGTTASFADDETRYPVPEAGVITGGTPGTCLPDSVYDIPDYYGADCSRLKVVFGPIQVKPGQNDILIQPVTVEKPLFDNHLVRFKPSLIEVSPRNLAISPPVEELHLHHGTWLNAGRSYGDGPWIASGEEKTVASWPKGYGLQIKPEDQWLFLHMVHNATALPREVWVTYDLDVVKAEGATRLGLKNTRGIWLDVATGSGWGQGERNYDAYPFNPIYNSQRGFGSVDERTFGRLPAGTLTKDDGSGRTVCSWPAQNCARFNSEGNVSAQQGVPAKNAAGETIAISGKDTVISKSTLGGKETGTLVVMGGHLHLGGIRDEISLVRDGVERPIHVSDAYYWNPIDSKKVGARPTSWDFSMTGASADNGWAVNVKAGDRIRLNSVYDSELGSWYENMGIVMTWVVPGDEVGVDVFAKDENGDYVVELDPGIPDTAKVPDFVSEAEAGYAVPFNEPCSADADTLCLRGQITHPHYTASGNHGDCSLSLRGCPALPTALVDGPLLTDIPMGGFNYGPADFAVIGLSGIPQVKVNSKVTFHNLDTADNMWHTVTRCAEPCTGPTTVDYPIANGGTGADDLMDFDSSELGIGLSVPNRVSWSFTPPAGSEDKTYTFYCRIHPSMRGAFKVVA